MLLLLYGLRVEGCTVGAAVDGLRVEGTTVGAVVDGLRVEGTTVGAVVLDEGAAVRA